MKTKSLILSLVLCLPMIASAQSQSLDTVIQRVLTHNFDVQVSRKSVEIAGNSATKGNAGLLPSVQLNSGGSYSNNNTELKFAGNIPPVKVDGAQNTSYNASIGASYTIFNGFANLRNYEKLMLAQEISEEQLRLTLENAVITTIGLYLDLTTITANVEAAKENLKLSWDRLSRMQAAQKLGVSTSLDVLTAKSDYNADSISLLNLEHQEVQVRRQINLLMGTTVTDQWKPLSVRQTPDVVLSTVLSGSQKNSVALVLADLQRESADLDVDIAAANRMPTLSVNASYGFVNSQNAAGIVLEQNNLGLSSGLNFTLPIYNGGKIKTAMSNSVIRMEQSEVTRSKTQQTVMLDVYNHWENLEYNRRLEAIQTDNLQVVQQRHDQALIRYRSGQITSLEYRDAQLALIRMKTEINSTQANAAKEVYQLLRLQGSLINQ
ncbi:MAG: TolC family protein [Flavobacteriales bacterium]|nr:TolC family protein [Flavobacteriales bacterium]